MIAHPVVSQDDASPGNPGLPLQDGSIRKRPSRSDEARRIKWNSRLRRLQTKLLAGATLTTEEIESVLLWTAIHKVRLGDPAEKVSGLDTLSAIYETRSKAKLAPGNAPPRPVPSQTSSAAAKKYGVEAPARPETTPTAAADESPRSWVADPG